MPLFETLAMHRRAKRRFAETFGQAGLAAPKVRFVFSQTGIFPYEARISREGGGFVVDIMGTDIDLAFNASRGRVESFAYWLSQCPESVRSIHFDFSDGDLSTGGRFSSCSSDPTKVLLPDPYFFQRRAFAEARKVAETAQFAWRARSSTVRWRGAPNGSGRFDFSDRAIMDPSNLPRLRMLMHLRKAQDVDAAFSTIDRDRWLLPMMKHFGFWGGVIPENDWVNDRFALDIDGFTNTWSNLMSRWHLGCCVLKVESAQGFRQWYYDRISPWQHYVPVASDMSDLFEKIDWARAHPDEAEEIALRGQAFARTMTMESETAFAVNAIVAVSERSPSL